MTTRSIEKFHIESVELEVTNLEKSISFYEDILGFTVIRKADKYVELGTKDEQILVVLHENKEARKMRQGETGIYHFAILVPERAQLAAFLKHISDKRYPLIGASDHLFSEAIYLEDPDQIGIEVYCDRPKEEWEEDNGEIKVATLPLQVEDLMATYKEPWTALPIGTIIGHLHFHVSSIKQARTFYMDQFGLDKKVEMGSQALFVSGEGYHHHIGLNVWNGRDAVVPEENVVGLKKANVTISVEDLHALRKSGVLKEESMQLEDPFSIKYGLSI
ncbi:VOC family protein [Saliterribacillus persicus]|uniref:Catechol 2,3-dioxygenase n=1 Tax=Saliterribacillus persicus TaxID=930114 RepID=A0A368YDL4_9BACI|nr:VOC family protein [Saliterribacillus persicus]RCW77518.1 catechol 2,3-dioxygenase [Saliterribacillus persicus]